MKKLLEHLHYNQNLLISTHRHPDGDGLGAGIALSLALQKQGKIAPFFILDPLPKKYHFLKEIYNLNVFDPKSHTKSLSACEGAIFLDTNDIRLMDPLYLCLEKKTPIHFIDHHPILNHGPKPEFHSYIDTSAASTGELVYNIICELKIPLDSRIAASLYTSITFDTQLYRYIRSSPVSHQIAAHLLTFDIQPEKIHQSLFAHQTPQKISFLAKALNEIQYLHNGSIAFLKLNIQDIQHYQLEKEESRDIIDMLMNIDQLQVAVLVREDAHEEFKISLRSKGEIPLLPLAESLGGGGHLFSSGAYYKGSFQELQSMIMSYFDELK